VALAETSQISVQFYHIQLHFVKSFERDLLDFQRVYRIAPDGTLTLLVADFDKPNGLAFPLMKRSGPDDMKVDVNGTLCVTSCRAGASRLQR
jgi:hypothetical protein